MIIGLTGRNASGKGTVGDWLVSQGFAYTSLSDAIRSWLKEQGKEPTRDNLTWAGRQLRELGGPGVLALRTLSMLTEGQDTVIDSIRNPAEVAVLRTRRDFVMVEVWAEEAVRYDRLLQRGRAGDARNFEEFARQESAELTSASAAGQQLVATAEMADVRLNNDGDPAALEALLVESLPQWRSMSRNLD